MTRRDTVRALSTGRYTVSASSGRRRATAVVTSVSHVSSSPLLVMVAESRTADVTIGASRGVLHCVVRHIVRVDSRAIVIMEVIEADLAA